MCLCCSTPIRCINLLMPEICRQKHQISSSYITSSVILTFLFLSLINHLYVIVGVDEAIHERWCPPSISATPWASSSKKDVAERACPCKEDWIDKNVTTHGEREHGYVCTATTGAILISQVLTSSGLAMNT